VREGGGRGGGELGWREPGNEAGEMYYIVALKWLEKKRKQLKQQA